MKKLYVFLILALASSNLLGSCLTNKNAGDYNKNSDYAFFELWNKDNQPIYFRVSQDLNKLLATPQKLEPSGRVIGWTTSRKLYTTINTLAQIRLADQFNQSQPTYVALYASVNSKPTIYKIDPNTTVYLSWTKDKGLYPQTGQWRGVAGYTETCLKLSNNVKKVSDITAQVKIPSATPSSSTKPAASPTPKPAVPQQQVSDEQLLKRQALEFIREAQVALKNKPADQLGAYPSTGIIILDVAANMKNIDPLQIFGFSSQTLGTNKSLIQKAFNKLSLKIHPDKIDPNDKKKKAIAQEAFKMLSDAKAKLLK
jgi:hypothetical protein